MGIKIRKSYTAVCDVVPCGRTEPQPTTDPELVAQSMNALGWRKVENVLWCNACCSSRRMPSPPERLTAEDIDHG
jgi:hypothetical protein